MDFEDQQISTTSETGMEELETELSRARAHSARMRQKVCDTTTGLEQGLDILEENVKSLPELLREKDGNKAMKTRVKKTLETIFKQMKESIENVMKAVEAEEMELLRKERDQMDDREKTPEERKKSIKKSTDCNNNVVVNETANCENELTADRTPSALEPNNSAVLSLDRQGKVGFIDRATSPLLKPTLSKSGVNCGTPTNDELELLGSDIASDWIKLGRRLGVGDPMLEEIAQAHEHLSEKGYHMLKSWKQIKGADATYQALCDALQHQLVQRQDLVEKHCYTNGKEAVEIELHRARVHSARMRQIVSDKTTSIEERLKTLEEQVKSLLEYTREKDCNKTMETRVQEILETTFKQLKESIENVMKDFELEEMEFLRKERDQMDDRKKTPEECKKLIEKSPDCNNNVVLNEITSCENELAVERTPNAFESETSPVSLDRQENMRVHDGATQPLKLTRSKSEGSAKPGGKMATGARTNPPISRHDKQKGKQIRYEDISRKSKETLVKDMEPDVLVPIVKRGKPIDEELEQLGIDIAEGWKKLGRRLKLDESTLQEIDNDYEQLSEKGYHMFMRWKQNKGANATYQALRDALQHKLVHRQDLVEKFCYFRVNKRQESSGELRKRRNSKVKRRTPTDEELEQLGIDIAKDWNRLGRRLQIKEPILQEINKAHDQLSEKGYHMLKRWKENNGADATYQVLCDALQHKLVQRQDLAEKFCYMRVSSTSHFQQDAHRRIIFRESKDSHLHNSEIQMRCFQTKDAIKL